MIASIAYAAWNVQPREIPWICFPDETRASENIWPWQSVLMSNRGSNLLTTRTAVSSYSVGWLTSKVAPTSVLKPTIAFLHLHLKRLMQLRSHIMSNSLRTGPNPICFCKCHVPTKCSSSAINQIVFPGVSWCFLTSLGICVFLLMRPSSITKIIIRST